MALRVLLADESSTIKKVFQLALQDYAVEVRPVNIGVDVSAVAKAFKPDIIFADVMLQKKNGYDVCSELKQDSQLRAIPIVLMWSGFVELDEDKFQASQANAQLEKPFDVAALRKLVSELVPRTQSQSLAQYLTFPKVEVDKGVEFHEEAKIKSDEEFTQGPPPKMKTSTEKYRLNLKPEELEPSHIGVDYNLPPADEIDVDDIFKSADKEPEEFTLRETKKPAPRAASPPPAEKVKEVKAALQAADEDLGMVAEDLVPFDLPIPPIPPPAPIKGRASASKGEELSADQIEKIIREQSAEVIESVVWKVIPELAAQIIERELNKLLKERDSNPY